MPIAIQVESYCKYRCTKWGTGALTLAFLILGIYSAVHAVQTEHPCILLSEGASIVYFILALISFVVCCLTKKKKLEQKKSAQFSLPQEVLVHLSSFLYPDEMVQFGKTCKAHQITCLQNEEMHTSWALFLGQPKEADASGIGYVHFFYQSIKSFRTLTFIHAPHKTILTYLQYGSEERERTCVSLYLLAHNPKKWDVTDEDGLRRLQYAFCEEGCRKSVEFATLSLLHEWGADINQPGPRYVSTWHALTPLSNCVFSGGHAENLRFLLENGADVNRTSGQHGNTPLQHALRAKAPSSTLTTLLEAGADINQRDDLGCNALHYASTAQALTILLGQDKQVVNVNQRDENGTTPLMKIVSWLLNEWGSSGVVIRGQACWCDWAIQARKVIIKQVDILIAHGADPNITDQRGRSPRSIVTFQPLALLPRDLFN